MLQMVVYDYDIAFVESQLCLVVGFYQSFGRMAEWFKALHC